MIVKKLILKPEDWPNARLIFNPGVYYDGEYVYLFPRIILEKDYEKYISRIGLFISKDGINFERKFFVVEPSEIYDKRGCEDPRVMNVENEIYMTYVALEYGAWTGKSRTALLRIKNILDKNSYEKIGIITWKFVDDKDVVLFPKKIRDKYVMLHRPNLTKTSARLEGNKIYSKFGNEFYEMEEINLSIDDLPSKPSIWISYSKNIKDWFEHKVLRQPEFEWENCKIGAGTPPIEIEEGFLLFYHGVEIKNNLKIYRGGAMLLDKKNPEKIIGITEKPIIEPDREWEKHGEVDNVVFPTGFFIKDNEVYLYYGGADKYVGLAIIDLDKLLNSIS